MGPFHRQLTRDFARNSAIALAVVAVFLSAANTPAGIEAVTGAPMCINDVPTLFVVLASLLDSALPFGLLLGTLFTVGALARYQELTALSAAGWPLIQIVRPLVVFALVGVLYSAALRAGAYSQALWSFANDPVVLSLHSVGTIESLASQTRRHADLAYPLVILFSVLVGVALAASNTRHSVFAGFGRAMLVLVGYNVISAIAQALGRHGVLPPVVAGWLPIFVVGIITGFLWVRVQR